MIPSIKTQIPKEKPDHTIILFEKPTDIPTEYADKSLAQKLKEAETGKPLITNSGLTLTAFQPVGKSVSSLDLEKIRKNAAGIYKQIEALEGEVLIINTLNNTQSLKAVLEGLVLAAYRFDKYKTDKKKKKTPTLFVQCETVSKKQLKQWIAMWEGVYHARDLVNEPNSSLTSVTLAQAFERFGKEAGFSVEVWNEAKIQAQKMGGLIAVNKGSTVPPTFSIMEHKPAKAINKKPIVLVGKGIVYDTGGMSLKPTPNSMDYMKCDMGGAATVGGLMYAIAKAGLPLHVIALVPSTDNRPGEEAYVPGDVITMYSGHTVEVKNTDAEGRLVLADALHYAKKLKPELVMDFATLTGAAVRAIGPYASAFMGTADKKTMEKLEETGHEVAEKLIAFPLWEEYAEELKSEVADLSNLGKGEGGHMSAGKFLEKFTDYPWIHFDIAGTAFVHTSSGYTPYGGTGVGVRLIFEYFNIIANE